MATILEQLRDLEKVQELDLNIDGLKKKKSDLPAHLKPMEQELALLDKQAAERKAKIEEQEKALRQIKAAQDLNNDRMSRVTQRTNQAQDTREFQAISTESLQLQKLKTQLEEQSKTANTLIETLAKEIESIQTKAGEIKTQRDAKIAEVSQAEGSLDGDLNRLLETRKTQIVGIDRTVLGRYDRVRSKKGGIGVVQVAGGRCKGCHIMLAPQLANQLRKLNEVLDCPNCHRILIPEVPNSPQAGESEKFA